MKNMTLGLSVLTTILVGAGPALAGAPAPAPLAGALGPVGIGIAAAGYVSYRVVKHYRNR